VKFLVDACSDARLAAHLRDLDHDVKRIGRDEPGNLPDRDVLTIAFNEQRILITDDRDFGDLIFKQRWPHAGMISLRLDTTLLSVRIARLDHVLALHHHQLNRFLVVGLDSVRIADEE
jgi:predicted nuclease of predicted toxin-antitoxin system